MKKLPPIAPIALGGLLATAAGVNAASTPPYVYGPPPDWGRYKELAEAAVRAKLPPSDWSFEWPNGYVKRSWRRHGNFPGYVTCAAVRTGAPVKGYNPVTQFVVVVDYDRVQTVDISGRESNSAVNLICEGAVSRGALPPAKMMQGSSDLMIASLGITVRSTPDGAYVVAVAPSSAAARAGLAAGTVLTRANGIALAGMGPAMAAVLAGATPALAIDTAAGGHVEVRRGP